MADPNAIAKQFVDFYYTTFSTNRAGLQSLYRPTSMLTFEAQQIQGETNISEKLTSLPFQSVKHQITTFDAQPSTVSGSLLVLVTGLLIVDDNTNPLPFSQAFQLIPDGSGYYVQNDVFRLNYG
ncbi:nuclear transport factor 2 [Auriculariales sp. MPI-PUGE-AT-0066]|nr:nuclear transport factor 2 [Auriculariales sp. MPI-PUGE-AT-0066]